MKTEIVITNNFSNEVKKFLKKYKSLKSELRKLNNQLLENPRLGKPIGKNSYKVRLAVKSKGKGKSGGLRIITHLDINVHIDELTNTVFLLSVYDKSETDSISKNELARLLSKLKINKRK